MNGSAPVRLAAILNSFNRLQLLRDALPALDRALFDCPFETAIIVFEAGSTDGSREWIEAYRKEHPNAGIAALTREEKADGSLSAGVNCAAQYALRSFPQLEWLLLYETDNWVAGPAPFVAATELLEQVADLAAAGFTAVKRSGEAAGFGCPFPTATQFVLGQQLTALLRLDRPRVAEWQQTGSVRWAQCDVVYTSPLLVRRRAWEQIGGPDAERFPFCDTDVDWSWRARKAGWRMAVIQTPEVVHDNRGVRSEWSARRVMDFHRARLRLLGKHTNVSMPALKALLQCRHLVELAALAVASPFLRQSGRRLRQRLELLRSVTRNYETEPSLRSEK